MEKRNSFVVDISNTPSTLIVFVSVANIFLMLLAWNFLGMVGFFIVMMLSSGFIAYKLLRPNELMLKIENKTATLYKNQVEIASCPDHQLEVRVRKALRFLSLTSRKENRYNARIKIKFPDGASISYSVFAFQKEIVFSKNLQSIVFDSFDADANTASPMQTQRLIDYYNLNHLLTFNIN